MTGPKTLLAALAVLAVTTGSPPIRDGDVSTSKESEDVGGVHRTASEQQQEALRIPKPNGMDPVHLEV